MNTGKLVHTSFLLSAQATADMIIALRQQQQSLGVSLQGKRVLVVVVPQRACAQTHTLPSAALAASSFLVCALKPQLSRCVFSWSFSSSSGLCPLPCPVPLPPLFPTVDNATPGLADAEVHVGPGVLWLLAALPKSIQVLVNVCDSWLK